MVVALANRQRGRDRPILSEVRGVGEREGIAFAVSPESLKQDLQNLHFGLVE